MHRDRRDGLGGTGAAHRGFGRGTRLADGSQPSPREEIQVAGWQILLGTVVAVFGLAGLFIASQLTGVLGIGGSAGLSIGWWGFTLGYLSVIVGAFISLGQLTADL